MAASIVDEHTFLGDNRRWLICLISWLVFGGQFSNSIAKITALLSPSNLFSCFSRLLALFSVSLTPHNNYTSTLQFLFSRHHVENIFKGRVCCEISVPITLEVSYLIKHVEWMSFGHHLTFNMWIVQHVSNIYRLARP